MSILLYKLHVLCFHFILWNYTAHKL